MIREILLFILVAICLVTDLRERKIYNKVVLTGMVLALVINLINFGLVDGLVFTLTGFFTGVFLLILPFIAGGIGAGDVKMLGMIGAFMGYGKAVEVLLAGAVVGGLFAVVRMVRQGGFLHRLRLTAVSGFMFLCTGKLIYLNKLDDVKDSSSAIPYGAALGAGVVIVYILGSPDKGLPIRIAAGM